MSEKRKEYKKPKIISGKVFDSIFACTKTDSYAPCTEHFKTVGCGIGRTSWTCYKT